MENVGRMSEGGSISNMYPSKQGEDEWGQERETSILLRENDPIERETYEPRKKEKRCIDRERRTYAQGLVEPCRLCDALTTAYDKTSCCRVQ
jgi:hypothetical protein